MTDFARLKPTVSRFLDHYGIIPDRPGSDTLGIVLSEFSNIPWENLTKFLCKSQTIPAEKKLRLADTVINENIEMGAGGTCFSLTEALGTVLSGLGYHCRPVMADMKHGKNIHCALAVETEDGELFLADPGYLVPVPVPVQAGKVSRVDTPWQKLVWEPAGNTFDLYSIDGDFRNWRYRIRMEPVSPAEFMHHWLRSFDSTGMNSLHLNRGSGNQRLSAHNMNLRKASSHGNSNEKLRQDYGIKIEKYFGLSSELAEAALREWEESCRNR
jgi:arylamine N-acetyltransferase